MNPESPDAKEAEPKHGAVRLFFEMDKKTEVSLKERIEKAKGLIRVFIHPDFERYSEFENIKDQPEDIEKLKEAEVVFRKILSSESETVPPLFIFEDGVDNNDFEGKEKRLGELATQDVYIIRTTFANPDPLPLGQERTYSWNLFTKIGDEEKSLMWKWLIEEFKKLGVKKILLGGLEFYVTGDKDKSHSGCMGTAMNKLKEHGFDVEISALTWPSGREDALK